MSTTPTISSAKPRIRVLGPARYLVESTSRPGLGHQVDVLRLRCGCEAGRHGRRCRHLILALAYDDWRRRQQAQAAATTNRPEGRPRASLSRGMSALQEAFS